MLLLCAPVGILCVCVYAQEVFCTNRHQMVRLRRVTGKCCVLRYKDYCKNTVEVSNKFPSTWVLKTLLSHYDCFRDLTRSTCMCAGIAITSRWNLLGQWRSNMIIPLFTIHIVLLVCTELGCYWEALGTGASATANEIGLCVFKVC